MVNMSWTRYKIYCHSKFSGGKQYGGSPEYFYSNPLINPNYQTADWLAVKYSVFMTIPCLDTLLSLLAALVTDSDYTVPDCFLFKVIAHFENSFPINEWNWVNEVSLLAALIKDLDHQPVFFSQ